MFPSGSLLCARYPSKRLLPFCSAWRARNSVAPCFHPEARPQRTAHCSKNLKFSLRWHNQRNGMQNSRTRFSPTRRSPSSILSMLKRGTASASCRTNWVVPQRPRTTIGKASNSIPTNLRSGMTWDIVSIFRSNGSRRKLHFRKPFNSQQKTLVLESTTVCF